MSLMIKIFGAVLIVSGGLIIGLVPSYYQKKRLARLYFYKQSFDRFYAELKEDRQSVDAYFSAVSIDEDQWLLTEEKALISNTINKIKGSSYQHALELCGELVECLSYRAKELETAEEKNGKARPIVIAALGLLLAVLLF